MRAFLRSVSIMALLSACAWAQVSTSQISGLIQDPTGAAVAPATTRDSVSQQARQSPIHSARAEKSGSLEPDRCRRRKHPHGRATPARNLAASGHPSERV